MTPAEDVLSMEILDTTQPTALTFLNREVRTSRNTTRQLVTYDHAGSEAGVQISKLRTPPLEKFCVCLATGLVRHS